MAGLRRDLCFRRLLYVIVCLTFICCFRQSVAANEQQPVSTATATTESRSCNTQDQKASVCTAEQNGDTFVVTPPSMTAGGAAAAAQGLQEQLRTQQQMLSVLSSISAGTFTADAAVSLLQDAAALRESLLHGAAARRWDNLKARSAKRNSSTGQGADKQQQQQSNPSRGILIVAGGQHQFANAYILLQLLRHPTINCTLPVELIYYGPSEFDSARAQQMKDHAAKTGTQLDIIDGYEAAMVTDFEDMPAVHLTGFKTKVHALAFVTTFEQVRWVAASAAEQCIYLGSFPNLSGCAAVFLLLLAVFMLGPEGQLSCPPSSYRGSWWCSLQTSSRCSGNRCYLPLPRLLLLIVTCHRCYC
jgi:hypothetical protein